MIERVHLVHADFFLSFLFFCVKKSEKKEANSLFDFCMLCSFDEKRKEAEFIPFTNQRAIH